MRDYEREPIGDNAMAQLEGMARKMAQLEAEVQSMTEELKRKQAELEGVSQRELPALMDELGLENFTTRSGLEIKVSQSYHASITKENMPAAKEYLERSGNGGLLKRTLTVFFGRDDEKFAKEFEQELASRDRPLDVTKTYKVEPSTLRAWVRKSMEAGEDIPQDVFGVFIRRQAEVKVPDIFHDY